MTEETTNPIVEKTTDSPPTDESLPKRYYVQFWKQVRPNEPQFDELAGTIYWSDVKQDIVIEGLHNKYATKIENFFNNDLALPNGIFVSYELAPKDWVRNLHKAQLIGGFYAKEFMEMIDETE